MDTDNESAAKTGVPTGMPALEQDLAKGRKVIVAWGAFTFIFNTVAGSDYGFLNRKPLNASMLDFLGPWPFYVLAEVVIVGAVWALMTWPWERKRRRQLSMALTGETHTVLEPLS